LSDALGAAGISSRDRSSARAPVYRAEAAGLIIFDHVRSNLTRVFANEADRAQYYADREEEELPTSRCRPQSLRGPTFAATRLSAWALFYWRRP
jgi:hypothetical protein